MDIVLRKPIDVRINYSDAIKNDSRIDQVTICNQYEQKKNSPGNANGAIAYQTTETLRKKVE